MEFLMRILLSVVFFFPHHFVVHTVPAVMQQKQLPKVWPCPGGNVILEWQRQKLAHKTATTRTLPSVDPLG
jgi:hypothetical protein